MFCEEWPFDGEILIERKRTRTRSITSKQPGVIEYIKLIITIAVQRDYTRFYTGPYSRLLIRSRIFAYIFAKRVLQYNVTDIPNMDFMRAFYLYDGNLTTQVS